MDEAREPLPSLSSILTLPISQNTMLTRPQSEALSQIHQSTNNIPQDWNVQPLNTQLIQASTRTGAQEQGAVSALPIYVPYLVNIPQIFSSYSYQTLNNNNNNNSQTSSNNNSGNSSINNNGNSSNNNIGNLISSSSLIQNNSNNNHLPLSLPICKTTSSCKTKVKIGSGKISLIRKTVFTSVIQKFPCRHEGRPPCASCISNQGRSITSVCTQYYEVNYPPANSSSSPAISDAPVKSI